MARLLKTSYNRTRQTRVMLDGGFRKIQGWCGNSRRSWECKSRRRDRLNGASLGEGSVGRNELVVEHEWRSQCCIVLRPHCQKLLFRTQRVYFCTGCAHARHTRMFTVCISIHLSGGLTANEAVCAEMYGTFADRSHTVAIVCLMSRDPTRCAMLSLRSCKRRHLVRTGVN